MSVERELGCLGSLETGEVGEEVGVGAAGKLTPVMMLTDPVQAHDFVARTGVDALAIAIGASHCAHKFTRSRPVTFWTSAASPQFTKPFPTRTS